MDKHASVFDVLEADARTDETASDRALAAARVRGQKFAKYVAAYGEDALEGLEEHIDKIATETTAEYGGDPEAVREAVVAFLKEGMPGPQNAGDSYQGETIDMGDGKPKESETGLDSVGSPKIDKSDLPESLRQEPIDVGSVRNPAERQSIQHDVADLGDTPGEGIEQARNDAVTKTVSADEPIGSEEVGARTDTWSEAQQQAVAARAAKWSVPVE